MLNPGDLFEWVEPYGKVYRDEEQLYSFAMKKYVRLGGLCLCTGIDKTTLIIHWISHSGIFYARTSSHAKAGFIRVLPKTLIT